MMFVKKCLLDPKQIWYGRVGTDECVTIIYIYKYFHAIKLILKVIECGWRQERAAVSTKEIKELLKDHHDRYNEYFIPCQTCHDRYYISRSFM
jgi:hypothetical protein